MSDTTDMSVTTEPLVAADGTPLRKKLAQAMFQSRLRAFGLVAPLLAFIIVAFILPIMALLWQGVYDSRYSDLMPQSAALMKTWDGTSNPTEDMFAALVTDMVVAKKEKTIE